MSASNLIRSLPGNERVYAHCPAMSAFKVIGWAGTPRGPGPHRNKFVPNFFGTTAIERRTKLVLREDQLFLFTPQQQDPNFPPPGRTHRAGCSLPTPFLGRNSCHLVRSQLSSTSARRMSVMAASCDSETARCRPGPAPASSVRTATRTVTSAFSGTQAVIA